MHKVRVSKSSFSQLALLIENHEIFQNDSYRTQAPVREQLMVFLAKLDRFGNSGSVGILARYFCISEGTVEMYIKRCVTAIMSLERQVVFWPSSTERLEIAARIEADHGFEGCVGFVDGTLFPLYAKPSQNGEDYYCRKGFYGVNGMVICDDKKRIRYLDLGWPGAVHDMRVWSNSDIGYLLGAISVCWNFSWQTRATYMVMCCCQRSNVYADSTCPRNNTTSTTASRSAAA